MNQFQTHLPTMALLFAVTLALSLGLTPLARLLALKRGLVDMPGDARRVHASPVPRLGGLAMYAAFAVGVLLTFVVNINRVSEGNGRYESTRVLLLLAGAGIIALVMAVDDIRGLRPLPRLLWQVGVALLVVVPSLIWPGGSNDREVAGTVHFDQGAGVLAIAVQSPFGGTIQLPLLMAIAFTLFWIVGSTNTINWIDGLDGLAGGVTVVACLVLFVITGPVLGQWTLAYLPLLLGASTLGFLPYNVHPARIFMGDSGAMFIGFTLAVISIIGGAKLAVALLVIGIPMLDGVYMIIYRLYRGKSPLSADRGHLHHRLLDIGLSQQQVVMVFLLLCGLFGLIS
ncbi:MAG: undecaprenyl/decaprenyl-phosphate alpha-N-acetylglucosaminyl 1-phosphate transferase, partial [Chloroflexota bacterium]|nr:undecaprenyl/decaprenyl-phosphate alpha-N-acetylglucosaminyl 1-phosphate transferase [Chloroflexota bacterium]